MALNFPDTPTVGQIFPSTAVAGVPTWKWDGAAWVMVSAGSVAAANSKNYIVNGAMMVSQENGTAAGTATGYYCVDQFTTRFLNGGGVSIAQVASSTPAGSPNRMRVTVTAADASVAAGDWLSIQTRIEGYRFADALYGSSSAKTLTLQFGVKAPAGTHCVTFANSADNRCYVAEYVISAGEANTNVVKSVTIPGDQIGTWLKDGGIGLEIRWGLMAGSTFQQAAGSWGTTAGAVGSSNQFNLMGTNGNVFELFDVGLYSGNIAPAFVVPDFATEVELCKRYFDKSYNHSDVPGTATQAGAVLGVSPGNVNRLFFNAQFATEKRATPAVTFYGTSGAAGKVTDLTSSSDFAVSAFTTGARGISWNCAAGIPLVTDFIVGHWVANARM